MTYADSYGTIVRTVDRSRRHTFTRQLHGPIVRSMVLAFTLIETLIVEGILGILAAIVVPKFSDAAAPAIGVGRVCRDDGNGVFDLYATDSSWLAEYVEQEVVSGQSGDRSQFR